MTDIFSLLHSYAGKIRYIVDVIIKLTRNQLTQIDDRFAHLADLSWQAAWKDGTKSFYAQRSINLGGNKWRAEVLGRRICEEAHGRQLSKNEYVDHRNHDTLDNRLENLRIVSRSENARNRSMASNNTSGFKGVSLKKYKNGNPKWLASCTVENHQYHIGTFHDIHQAAFAYDLSAHKAHGEFAWTNYPAAAYGLEPWSTEE